MFKPASSKRMKGVPKKRQGKPKAGITPPGTELRLARQRVTIAKKKRKNVLTQVEKKKELGLVRLREEENRNLFYVRSCAAVVRHPQREGEGGYAGNNNQVKEVRFDSPDRKRKRTIKMNLRIEGPLKTGRHRERTRDSPRLAKDEPDKGRKVKTFLKDWQPLEHTEFASGRGVT